MPCMQDSFSDGHRCRDWYICVRFLRRNLRDKVHHSNFAHRQYVACRGREVIFGVYFLTNASLSVNFCCALPPPRGLDDEVTETSVLAPLPTAEFFFTEPFSIPHCKTLR